jgi:hypothetical protein
MRNVRPAWVSVQVDGAKRAATGPRGRAGTLSALFSARIDGEAVPFLRIDAVGSEDGASTAWCVVDVRTGRIVFLTEVPQ